MPYVHQQGNVSILYLGEEGEQTSENRFHPDWLASIHSHLDDLEARSGPSALVTTAAGKFYSTGADLDWCAANPDQVNAYLDEVQVLFARLLALPVPTVAALQGHTFGAGAFLALAHDHKIMRSDRGFFCLPGINIGVHYTPGVLELAAARLPVRAAHEALLTGRRYGGQAALELGIVEDVAPADELLSRAVAHAESVAHTRGEVLGKIKRQLYARTLDALRAPVGSY
ncbi:enoyl-CoA hydratase/isomerase family protein [Skermania sp. ID1734]|uniref:enoyl-CoA hydratase/isomerase family protein n=1 Tax=Skermania sp. ID1734 TaxID=2597516 RepID=UPI00117DA7E5|nr:enoyl-CoA hydratase/isomerase family protein [Skermania sp. ID1734]TSE01956.1 enoyl-CoA hydratase/isomerase family protein [Skermania sp. ID1734]